MFKQLMKHYRIVVQPALPGIYLGTKLGMKGFLFVGGSLYLFGDFVGYPVKVNGTSMQPTLNNSNSRKSDWIFLNRWCSSDNDYKHGDIVIFICPDKPNEKYIKRIIANENECVRSSSGDLISIPKGHCWVEGDNAKNSSDSNVFGPLAKGLIVGKATHLIWPPTRWKNLQSDYKISKYPVRCPAV